MIDWELTTQQFGITPNSKLTKRPKIVCRCDNCPKTKIITVRVKSRLNEGFPWLCNACVASNRKSEISQTMKELWKDETYRNAQKESHENQWDNNDFRNKHSTAVKKAMQHIDINTILTERYKDQRIKQKIQDSSRKLWNNTEFRLRHLRSMNTDKVKKIIGAKARSQWRTTRYRDLMANYRSQQTGKISSIQQMLYDLLDDLNITYYKVGLNTQIGYYHFDCLIPNINLLIECHGDYWHSLSKAEMRDRQKFTYITKYFPQYKIAYIWEREFYQHDRVLSRLRSLFGQQQPIVDFKLSDVIVKPIDTTRYFLNLYHYLGPGRGGIKIGAFLNDELIAVAIFSKPLRQNINHQFGNNALECSRFCIHPSYHKKNFASWFLNKCTNRFSNIIIYSYADSTVGHTGTIYKAAGWNHHHSVPPDYWYTDIDGYVMHKKTLYNRAQNLKMTENEFATKYNYQKIIGGPKECFIKQT